MVTKEDLLYRQIYTLKDGARVLIRPLTKDDKQCLLDLFIPVPPEERRYMRHNINDPQIITSWVEDIDYDRNTEVLWISAERLFWLWLDRHTQ